MRTAAKVLLTLGLSLSVPALAGPAQHIELTDGSIVRAEVVSLDSGTYVVRSDTLGQVEIPAANVRSISSGQQASSTARAGNAQTANIDGIRESIVNDPGAMNKIQSLQGDPLVTDILNDPETMRAINAGDLDTLKNNPKIKALMEHSTVQELTQGAH